MEDATEFCKAAEEAKLQTWAFSTHTEARQVIVQHVAEEEHGQKMDSRLLRRS